jgi:hypothetical protein
MKEISYTTRRTINWLPIKGDLVAYIHHKFLDDKLISTDEGITTLRFIEDVEGNQGIIHPNAIIRGEVKGKYTLYKKEVRDVVRRYPYGWDKLFAGLKEMHIDNPYSYLQENSYETVELLHYSGHDGNLYDMTKTAQPKAIHFEYISAHMNNRRYDLEEVVRTLEKRDDIIWVDQRKTWEKLGEDGSKIQSIPYYNAEEDMTHCLDFIWTPSDEDFKKVLDDIHSSHRRYDAICSKVLGLTKLADY